VTRHAHASRAVIGLMRRGNDLVVTVTDNGRGIVKTLVAKPGACGVIGMRERALTLDGTLVLTGARGKGTTLTVCIPLSRVLITRDAAPAP
jgi:signal transduction histidine kinase